MPVLKHSVTLLIGAAAHIVAGQAQAQDQPVTVQLSGVQTTLAAQTGLASSIIPGAVQLPIDAAAKACGIDPVALAEGPLTCTAVNPTPDLTSAAMKLIATGDTPDADAD